MNKAPPIYLFLLLAASNAYAQDFTEYLYGEEALGLVHNASIEVIDNVTGNCWTNSNAIKQKARLTLEQSGIAAYLEPLAESFPYAASVYISAFGKRSPGSLCYGAIEVSISDTASRYLGDTPLPSGVVYFEDRSVAIGPDLNEPFSEAVEASIDTLAGTILSNRRGELVEALIDEHGDELKAKPETSAEMRERLEMNRP